MSHLHWHRGVRESINFKGAYGQAFLEILAAICQLEKEMIFERMYEARIAKAERRGIPPFGKAQWPVARDYVEGEWILDDEKTGLLRWAAREYLESDISLQILCNKLAEKGMKTSPQNLRMTFLKRCGDKYVMEFKVPDPEDEDKKIPYPVELPVPPILKEETISKLREKLKSKAKSWNSDSASEYPLKGYIFCAHCHKTLTGQTQRARGRKKYHVYYRHRADPDCKAFSYVRAKEFEDSFFKTIFEVFYDKPSFDKAIKDSLPDKSYLESLEKESEQIDKRLKAIQNYLNRLTDLVMKEVLDEEMVKQKKEELFDERGRLRSAFVKTNRILRFLPTIEMAEKEADKIRRKLIKKYKSPEHLKSMDYDAKRRLIHWIFRDTGEAPRKSNKVFPKKGIFVKVVDKVSTSYIIHGTILNLFVHYEPSNNRSSYTILDSDKNAKEIKKNAYNDYKSEHIPEYDGSYPAGAYSRQTGRYRTYGDMPG